MIWPTACVLLPQYRSEKLSRLVFVLAFNNLVIPLQDDLYCIAEHMGSRGEIACLRNVFRGPYCTNQMGIKALIRTSKNEERKLQT